VCSSTMRLYSPYGLLGDRAKQYIYTYIHIYIYIYIPFIFPQKWGDEGGGVGHRGEGGGGNQLIMCDTYSITHFWSEK
jgi:hypothetical protein